MYERTRFRQALVWLSLVAAWASRPAHAADLTGKVWKLTQLAGETVLADSTITLQFEDGRVSGTGGVNRYFGDCKVDGQNLRFGVFGRTNMAGPDPLMRQEDRFLEVLAQCVAFELEAGELYLLDAQRRAQLEFVAAPAPTAALEGTWLLLGIGARSVLKDVSVTAVLNDGRISGNTGVNQYSGDYTATGDGLTFGALISTKRAGPPPLMDQESSYLQALEAVRGWQAGNGELRLLDAAGQVVVKLARADVAAQTLGAEVLATGPIDLVDGRVWVALRPLADWLGADVKWQTSSHTATTRRGNRSAQVTVGSAVALIDGRTKLDLGARVFVEGGRVYVPLKLLRDAFDVTLQPSTEEHTLVLVDAGPGGHGGRAVVTTP